MDSSRPSYKRQSFRQPLDRRVDKWIETGRQFVDGVAGNRPGIRRRNSIGFTGANLEKVGRWVGEKVDWFLEDEDSWLEPWQTESQMTSSSGKKPLDAISRRVPKASSLSFKESQDNFDKDSWPEPSSFRLERWQRGRVNDNNDSQKVVEKRRESGRSERRPLPRSSRRR
ncbi:RNA helicase [Prochlorococcus sp. MIT 1307]|uniref:RNA helicase n=1 Tax=Prochlorococcus sp. MIT 1307 TaxID=3096219 RepID=UPI002A7493CC|nr:RNA helicase [Prochlorococcus sp. MIT 1307]